MVVIKMSFVTITRVLLGTGEPSVPIHYRHCTLRYLTETYITLNSLVIQICRLLFPIACIVLMLYRCLHLYDYNPVSRTGCIALPDCQG